MLRYRLATSRLILYPFDNCFLSEDYIAWLNDKEMMKFSEQRHRAHTVSSCKNYIASIDHSTNFLWAITEIAEKARHIGNISCHLDKNNNIADVGILLGDKDAQGRGFASEAWEACLYFLVNTLGIRKVTAGCMSSNHSMIRIMESSGMVPDGIRRNHYYASDGVVDILHMALFKEGCEHLRKPKIEIVVEE